MQDNTKKEKLVFENKPIINHGLIEIVSKTLEINDKILEVINSHKKELEEIKKNG
jgi:hypothetical protein